MKPQSPTTYLRNKDIQNSFFYRIEKGGEEYFVIEGGKVPREVIDKKYPMASEIQSPLVRYKGENCSSRQKLIQ